MKLLQKRLIHLTPCQLVSRTLNLSFGSCPARYNVIILKKTAVANSLGVALYYPEMTFDELLLKSI